MASAEFMRRIAEEVRSEEARLRANAHAQAVLQVATDRGVPAADIEAWLSQPSVDLLDPLTHLADGAAQLPACGATFVWHAGVSNVTPWFAGVTCEACKPIGEERGWERDEERRLQYAGEAARDRAVDAQIEASRLGDI